MSTITRCPAGAAAVVATQVRGGKRAANIVTTVRGHSVEAGTGGDKRLAGLHRDIKQGAGTCQDMSTQP